MSHRIRIGLSLLVLSVSGLASAATVGEMHLATTTPTAALRDAAGSPKLSITVWYPATDGVNEQPLDMGPPGKRLFVSGRAAADAPFAAGTHAVVLLSHGFGGTARMMGWFGTGLARAGYVVIAVDHPGNNGMGPITQAGAALWWERAEDLKAALAAVRADKVIASHIDPKRGIGVAGFSLGGFTSLVAAGARVDVSRFVAFCQAHPQDGVCKPQKEAPQFSGTDAWDHAFDPPAMKAQLARASGDHAIAGVRAIYVMGPALVQALDPASLSALKVRTGIIVGSADPIAQPDTNANVAARGIRGSALTTLPNVKHYDFLGTCTDAGKASVPLCEGVSGQDATHEKALAEAKALFNDTLKDEAP